MDRARRACPVGNKQCHARFVKQCQEKHKKKLSEMKCSIDNSEPKRHPHLRKNLKKEQLLEERYAEIERDNRLLLEKMSFIMSHSSLDNENQVQYAHSLNREQRKRELHRITRENQSILSRIQAAEPTYNASAWVEHEKQHNEYMKNICELPLVINNNDIVDGDEHDDDLPLPQKY